MHENEPKFAGFSGVHRGVCRLAQRVSGMAMRGDFFDAPALWREAAMSNTLHSGSLVAHPRSADVTCL